MALTFSHAVGYRGNCQLRKKQVLCTGGNINLTQEPIMGSGVWGAGYANAAQIAYAWNYLTLEGSANFELTTGGVWGILREACFTDRTVASEIVLLPDGVHGFTGNGWVSSLSFEASEGAAISGSFNFKGDPSQDSVVTDSGNPTYSKDGTGSAKDFAGATLVPYWKTSVSATGLEAANDIISWNCSYNSDLQMLKCCRMQSAAPKSADYILIGDMTGDCSITVFKIQGQFDPNDYHTELSNLTFNVGSTKSYITIPKAIINSASTSMATGASYVSAEFSYTALGDGTGSIMNMVGDDINLGNSSSTPDPQPTDPTEPQQGE